MVLANLFLKNNLSFSVAHCNFKLRSKESDIDQDFVKKWSLKHKIHCHSNEFNTVEFCKKNKMVIQDWERKLIYDCLMIFYLSLILIFSYSSPFR